MSAAMNEEVQKKNTDCVYFLASPLTCKKGNDCEFRHSESARNNPRDCWYWLSGSCLNVNCAFRHPPLEELPEGELAAGGKSRVPCYYFLQGYCAKGDKCIFMHGLATTASATEVSQKASKSNIARTGEVLDNQTSANKENGSVTSKTSYEYYEGPSDALAQKSSQVVEDVDANIANRMPECSDSSAPARSRPPQRTSSDRLKQVASINGRLHQVHPSDDKFLHQEAQTEDDPLCDFQPGDDGLGQDASGEGRVHNGTESEEMWEESSFDVLVDDGGTDQLIYADDLDYLNQYDAIVDQLSGHIQAGIRGTEGFVDFDYDHTGAYSQYYDAEYELATYDPYEQQLVYKQLSSFDPEDGIQPVVAFKNRQAMDMLPRDRRDTPYDGEARAANVGSNDLRNHIVKRRRAEKNQKYGEDYHRRRHQGNGSQHNRRHQDGHLKQQEGLGRRHMSPQTGSRSNRQYQGRGDPLGGRQFQGRLVEPLGAKRAYRDMDLDHEETSVERGSGKKFRGMNENFKAKGKKERGWPAAIGADEALGNRGQLHSKKAEVQNDDASFAGPKSLAQIKAEKMKAIGERDTSQQQESVGELNGGANEVSKRQVSQMRSKISQASKEPVKAPKPPVCKESDFESPKPLSVILKHKHGEDGNGEPKEQRRENESFGLEGGKRTAGSVEHGSRRYREKGSQEQGAASFSTNRGEHVDTHSNRLDKEADPEFDTEDGVDIGDGVMEDVDFEDDEEDDFAKKLGGFFS
eukprot:c17444_g1_i1 orf=330-2573(-)